MTHYVVRLHELQHRTGYLNLQDWKKTDEIARVEFAGLGNDGLEMDSMVMRVFA